MQENNLIAPNFIKVYLDCILTFNGGKYIPSDFLLGPILVRNPLLHEYIIKNQIELCKYVTYDNKKGEQMYVKIAKKERDEIASVLGVSDTTIKRHLKNCIDNGILFRYNRRAYFILNPFLIAKDEWSNINELKAEFNFISGTWKYIKGKVSE